MKMIMARGDKLINLQHIKIIRLSKWNSKGEVNMYAEMLNGGTEILAIFENIEYAKQGMSRIALQIAEQLIIYVNHLEGVVKGCQNN